MEWNEKHPDFDDDAFTFFGEDPTADFKQWIRWPGWTLDEATSLSFGYDPRVVRESYLIHRSEHPFAATYINRLEMARRAVQMKHLLALNSPEDYVTWAKKVGIDIPPQLDDALQDIGAAVHDWQFIYQDVVSERDSLRLKIERLHEEKKLDSPVTGLGRKSLLTMVAVMAKHGYK